MTALIDGIDAIDGIVGLYREEAVLRSDFTQVKTLLKPCIKPFTNGVRGEKVDKMHAA